MRSGERRGLCRLAHGPVRACLSRGQCRRCPPKPHPQPGPHPALGLTPPPLSGAPPCRPPLASPLPAPSLPPLQERQLDLVLIADKSEPVICKIVSYDKFRFNKEKKKKEQARRSPRWRLQSEAAV